MSREEKFKLPSEPHGTSLADASSDPNAEPTRRLVVEPHVQVDLAEQHAHGARAACDTVLPPAPDSERRQNAAPLSTSSSGFASRPTQVSTNRYPSAPPSIRPSVATMPPRVRAAEGGVISSLFWGALAIAFGASAGAVYWELAEEPQHSALANTASVAAPPTFANMPPMDRRRNERVTEWLPVRLDAGSAGLAVTHNVSETGALLVTGQTLQVGQVVRIIAAPPDAEEITLEGRVVRFSPNAEDPEGLWPYSVAVEFDEPSPELQEALRRLAP